MRPDSPDVPRVRVRAHAPRGTFRPVGRRSCVSARTRRRHRRRRRRRRARLVAEWQRRQCGRTRKASSSAAAAGPEQGAGLQGRGAEILGGKVLVPPEGGGRAGSRETLEAVAVAEHPASEPVGQGRSRWISHRLRLLRLLRSGGGRVALIIGVAVVAGFGGGGGGFEAEKALEGGAQLALCPPGGGRGGAELGERTAGAGRGCQVHGEALSPALVCWYDTSHGPTHAGSVCSMCVCVLGEEGLFLFISS